MFLTKPKFSIYEYLTPSIQKVNENNPSNVAIPEHKWTLLSNSDKLNLGKTLIELVCTAYSNTEKGSFIRNQHDVDISHWLVLSFKGDGIINCVIFYRDPRPNESWKGFKIQGIGHDSTTSSKIELLKHVVKLFTQEGWWAEARGAAAKAYIRLGSIPSKDEKLIAALFPNTSVQMVNRDIGVYTRDINGHNMAEQVFGHPVLKHPIKKYDIYEYIQLLEAENEWTSIKNLIPGCIIKPSDHLKDRALERDITVDQIKNAIINVVRQYRTQLTALKSNIPFTLVNNDIDIGMVKKLNQLYMGMTRDMFIILTVHDNLHQIPGYDEYIAKNAKNKARRKSPEHVKSFDDLDYDNILAKVHKKVLGDNIYSYSLRNLQELTVNQNVTPWNVNKLYEEACDMVYKNINFDSTWTIRNAKLKSPIYVVDYNQKWKILYNPYSVLNVYDQYKESGIIQVKFITMDQLEKFNNAGKSGQRTHQVAKEFEKLKEFFEEKERKLQEVSKVIIDYDPNDLGAYVRSTGDKPEPTVMIPFGKLDVLEPESKMDKSESSKKLEELIKVLKQGKKLEPILVRRLNGRYQILDGHHRYAAYKILKIKSIPARIIDPKNVKIYLDKKSVET